MDDTMNNIISFAMGIILCIIFWLIIKQKYVVVKKNSK